MHDQPLHMASPEVSVNNWKCFKFKLTIDLIAMTFVFCLIVSIQNFCYNLFTLQHHTMQRLIYIISCTVFHTKRVKDNVRNVWRRVKCSNTLGQAVKRSDLRIQVQYTSVESLTHDWVMAMVFPVLSYILTKLYLHFGREIFFRGNCNSV